jgi:hypothetical protein
MFLQWKKNPLKKILSVESEKEKPRKIVAIVEDSPNAYQKDHEKTERLAEADVNNVVNIFTDKSINSCNAV